jgi:hypothetical protein
MGEKETVAPRGEPFAASLAERAILSSLDRGARVLQSFRAESYVAIVSQRSCGRFETLSFGWVELGAAQAAREGRPADEAIELFNAP